MTMLTGWDMVLLESALLVIVVIIVVEVNSTRRESLTRGRCSGASEALPFLLYISRPDCLESGMMTPSKLEDIEHAIEKAAAGWRPCHVTRRTSAKGVPEKSSKSSCLARERHPSGPEAVRLGSFSTPPGALLGRVLINRDW